MRRRCVQSFLLFLVAFVVGGLPASTQQLTGGVPPRVGYVWVGPRGTDGDTLGGLLQGLADFGYFEGRTIVLETRYADGDPGRLPHLFHELAALPVKVLVTPGTPTTRAAREATSIVPIVSVSSDPVGSGFAASLAQPGGNITGLSLVTGEGLAGKWLELLKEAVPRLTQVAVLWNPDNQASARQVFKLQEMAPLFGLKVIPVAARRADELDAAFATMRADGQAGGLIVTDDPFLSSVQEHLVAGAAARKLPALYGLGSFVEAGGLMSYSVGLSGVWRRAAAYIDRLLTGARPGELPIEQPAEFKMRINLRTARALALELPTALVARADEVIE